MNPADERLWAELQAAARTDNGVDMAAMNARNAPHSAWKAKQAHCARTGKYSFRSRKLALTRLGELRKKGVPLAAVYRCPSCHKWHLTSMEQPTTKKEHTDG